MATIKSYTDLEQSKKLAKILPLESADMYYDGFGRLPQGYAYTLISPNSFEYDKPCWSLATLLNVLPDTITSNDGIVFKLNIKKNIIEYSNPSLYLVYKSVKADNLIDACYEMIIRLNELKML